MVVPAQPQVTSAVTQAPVTQALIVTQAPATLSLSPGVAPFSPSGSHLGMNV